MRGAGELAWREASFPRNQKEFWMFPRFATTCCDIGFQAFLSVIGFPDSFFGAFWGVPHRVLR